MAIMTKEPETRPTHRWEAKDERRNVGGAERGARFVVGAAAAIGAYAVRNPWLKGVLGALGAMGLMTGASGYCPANRAMGRDSYHRPRP